MAIASLWLCCLELISPKLNWSVFQFLFLSNVILLGAEAASKMTAEKGRAPQVARCCFIRDSWAPAACVCCSFIGLIVVFLTLYRGAALPQEAVEGRITLAWIQGLVTQGIQPGKANQADISTLVIVGCYSNAASVTRQNPERERHTQRERDH